MSEFMSVMARVDIKNAYSSFVQLIRSFISTKNSYPDYSMRKGDI